jgi:hypothetical protein
MASCSVAFEHTASLPSDLVAPEWANADCIPDCRTRLWLEQARVLPGRQVIAPLLADVGTRDRDDRERPTLATAQFS